MLGQLGRERYLAKYPGGRPPTNLEGRPDYCFVQTQRCVGDPFLAYWRANGGLARQGVPLSDEFEEVSAIDGKAYRVQYFERARFEYHPENAGTPAVVLLGQVGREQIAAKYPSGTPWGPTLAPLADGKTFTAADGRFSVQYPADWNAHEVFNPLNASFSHPSERAYCTVSVLDETPGTTLAALDGDIERILEFERRYNRVVQLSKETVVVMGMPGYRHMTIQIRDGATLLRSWVYFMAGNASVRANCEAPEGRFANSTPMFDGIIGSVRVRGVNSHGLPTVAGVNYVVR